MALSLRQYPFITWGPAGHSGPQECVGGPTGTLQSQQDWVTGQNCSAALVSNECVASDPQPVACVAADQLNQRTVGHDDSLLAVWQLPRLV